MPYGIPKRFVGATLDDYEVDHAHGSKAVRDAVAEWIADAKYNVSRGRGILLYGNAGAGKTMLASIALQACIDLGFTGHFLKYEGFMKLQRRLIKCEIRFERHPDDEEAYAEARRLDTFLRDLRNRVEVLALDDVGKEHSTHTRFAEDELDFLLRHRYDLGLTTIMTSNYEISDWAKQYSPSMQSFLTEICDLIPVNSHDYRPKLLK